MELHLRKAERKQSRIHIGISGPSGSGKTYSALLLAKGIAEIWNKIAIIDTENGSAELYSHLGDYNVITLTAPFSPEKYINAIRICEDAGMEVIIIDSATAEWNGEGGCLDIHEKLGGRWQDWKDVTPRHRRFIDAIIQSPAHIIACTRRKQDYDMGKDSQGKTFVTKVGMKEEQRDGWEYELSLNFELDIRHNARASKDRTGLFMDKPIFVITEETGKTLKEWAQSGKEVISTPEELKIKIVKLLNGQGFYPNIKEEYETMILGLTGMSLSPENYQQIIEKLQQNGNTNTNKNALGTTPGDQSAGGSAPENNRASEK